MAKKHTAKDERSRVRAMFIKLRQLYKDGTLPRTLYTKVNMELRIAYKEGGVFNG